jgi:hypothetical protein
MLVVCLHVLCTHSEWSMDLTEWLTNVQVFFFTARLFPKNKVSTFHKTSTSNTNTKAEDVTNPMFFPNVFFMNLHTLMAFVFVYCKYESVPVNLIILYMYHTK